MCQGIFFECVFLVGTRCAEGIMACGHSRRFNRSNTWPHRPALYHLSRKLLPTGRRPHMALSRHRLTSAFPPLLAEQRTSEFLNGPCPAHLATP
jgi:hypothetical protein